MDAHCRPVLRAVESIVVPDKQHGRVLVLRDTRGVTDAHAVVPPVLVPVVARFNGTLTCEEIARCASDELGVELPIDVVVRLADELERGLFLEGERFRVALARVEREFSDVPIRPASHAGGAYHGEPRALAHYIEEACLAKAQGPRQEVRRKEQISAHDRHSQGIVSSEGRSRDQMVALVAPHIDPWRGAVGYG
ncbi:MAG: hypothetical protein M3O46_01190, partial [Myxococcota bacterium]|nr:hypothetical protein [Myxococcota bacterium]